MRTPAFWHESGGELLPRLLSPLGALTAAVTARRMARPGWQAPVPVICCGNVTVGGSGKTTLALDLGQRLRSLGLAPHFLLRGYGGTSRGTRRVRPGDDAALVGDEALLLAEIAPTWVGADRAASARAAVDEGADVLILDDGLQNPTLVKNLSLLVVDGGFGFGNRRVVPAGPLREPVAAAAARCAAAVLIGEDQTEATPNLPHGLPVLRARLAPGRDAAAVAGRRVLAFAGIGRPAKFFATLRAAAADVVGELSFPDHHKLSGGEFRRIMEHAQELDALPVTTSKDAARLAPDQRAAVRVVGVELVWEEAGGIEGMLRRVIQCAKSCRDARE